MRKLLWCGGSHLANAKRIIDSVYVEFDNVFYMTGGEKNRDWAKDGGRYKTEGTVVGCNAHEPSLYHDLKDYSLIIFVGQYIQPQRYFLNAQPLSSSLLNAMLPLDSFLLHVPGGIFNEPLDIFPRIAPNKCFLVCDPMPSSENYITQVPIKAKKFFLQRVTDYCKMRDIALAFQPSSTLEETLSTQVKFRRKSDDHIHMNDEFWHCYLKGVYSKIVSSVETNKAVGQDNW